MKWDYLTLSSGTPFFPDERLIEAGNLGWELICVNVDNGNNAHAYFKRLKPSADVKGDKNA